MKDKCKRGLQWMKPYAIPGLITLAVVLVTLLFKGIWPFGSKRIDYFDNMQQVAPLYTHLWDWMHGDASLWFDWYTGLGTNVSMSISAFSMLSPFNLILYLVPRNMILESISILTAVKMVFMSVTMYIVLDRRYHKLQYCLKATFAVMFSLCGYVLLYGSCFTPWMDIVAIFPLLMLAYDHMMKTGKKLFYILMIGLVFIINYYLSAMSLVYIFLISGAYVLLRCERKTWKDHAWNLGIGTAAGMGLSAFVLVPVMMQLSTSQRGSSGSNLLGQYKGWLTSSIINDGTMAAFQRWMMLYGLAFVIAIIIIGFKKYWSEKKVIAYVGSVLGIAVLPIVVEGTNLMWHFGSYNGYTLRNGYLISFTLICIAAYFAEKMFTERPVENGLMKKQAFAAIFTCVAYMLIYNLMPDNNEIIAIVFFMIILVVLLVIYYRKISAAKDAFNPKSVLALVAVELFIGAYALIGPPKFYTYEDYQVGDYVQYANDAYQDLDIEDSATDRIVNPDISLNANYPLILRRGALSSFTAALQSNTQTFAKNWGYSKYFLWLLDSGGTVFTNSLIHVTQAVNMNQLDSEMYTLVKQDGDYSLYNANYQLPFAMAVPHSFARENLGGDWVDLHNKFYTALSGDKEELVTGMPYAVKKSESSLEYSTDVTGKGAVYMKIVDVNNRNNDANNSWLISSMHIYVNGEAITVPTLGDVNNTAYFTDYNNNLVYLGTFDQETIDIRIEYDDPWYLKVSEVTFAQLDMNKMAALCDSYQNSNTEVTHTNDSLTIKMTTTPKKNLALIPVIYSENWKVTVNGEATKAQKIGGLFTGVNLKPGENVIELKFTPKGKKEGMLITLAVIVLLLLCVILDHFKKLQVPALFKYCAVFIYLQLYNAIVVAMFILPVIAVVPAFIYQIVMKIMHLF